MFNPTVMSSINPCRGGVYPRPSESFDHPCSQQTTPLRLKLKPLVTTISLALSLFLISCQLPPQNKILESSPISGFEQVGPITVYNKSTLFDFMNGEVVVYFPLGFRLLYTQVYRSEATDARILVEIYDMSSPDGSRSVYEDYSKQEGSAVDGIGESAWTDRWLLLFRRHIYFVRLSPDPLPEEPERPTQEEMHALARKIDDLLH